MKRLALLVVVVGGTTLATFTSSASADDGATGGYTAFDISWPQCPANLPQERFEFAVIGLNGGRPFTSNPCFSTQYRWARAAQSHPDVYINVDFPRQGLVQAENGPHGRCDEDDQWCRGYNWGWNLAENTIARAKAYGITPARYWLDVETDNYWTDHAPHNAQVVRGTIDYFLKNNVPIGIYSTYYQWGLITGDYMPQAQLPIWVAGATNPEMAADRCSQQEFGFAGGEIWMVQYVRTYDQNHACAPHPHVQNTKQQPNTQQRPTGVAVTPPQPPAEQSFPAMAPGAPQPSQGKPVSQAATTSAPVGVIASVMEAVRSTLFISK